MKKLFMLPLMALALCVFSGCGEDEPEPEVNVQTESVKALKALKENQFTYGPLEKYALESNAMALDDETVVHVEYYNLDKKMAMNMRVHIKNAIVGKEINLAKPWSLPKDAFVGIENQLYSIWEGGVDPGIDYGGALFYNYWEGVLQSNYTYRIFGTEAPYTEFKETQSCFKEGTLLITKKSDGIHMTLNGTLQSGLVIAIKSFAPAD